MTIVSESPWTSVVPQVQRVSNVLITINCVEEWGMVLDSQIVFTITSMRGTSLSAIFIVTSPVR